MPRKGQKSQHPVLQMADRIEMWPVSRLVPYDRNPRTHSQEQISQICASIIEFGFTNPVLVDADAGILAGHGRFRAAMMLGLEEIPVVPLDHLSEEQRRAYIIADNKLAENSGWDMELLKSEIEALEDADFNTDLLGFSDAELTQIVAALEEPEEGATDQDDAPELPAAAEQVVSRPGDLWLMGPHRLLVGDMLDPAVRAQLMDGREASLIITDPPYGVDYTGKTEDQLKIENDAKTAEERKFFLAEMAQALVTMMARNASLYLFYPSAFHSEFEAALAAAGIEVRTMLVWVKNTFALSWGRYKFAHEPVLYCHLKGQTDEWYGGNAQQTTWMEKKPSASRQHPTMKPVELLERAIINSSRRGELVVDPFGGSGSTLIACQRMGRACATIEIDPFYADVILKRWMAFTKDQARLEDGRTFLTAERERYRPVTVEIP